MEESDVELALSAYREQVRRAIGVAGAGERGAAGACRRCCHLSLLVAAWCVGYIATPCTKAENLAVGHLASTGSVGGVLWVLPDASGGACALRMDGVTVEGGAHRTLFGGRLPVR